MANSVLRSCSYGALVLCTCALVAMLSGNNLFQLLPDTAPHSQSLETIVETVMDDSAWDVIGATGRSTVARKPLGSEEGQNKKLCDVILKDCKTAFDDEAGCVTHNGTHRLVHASIANLLTSLKKDEQIRKYTLGDVLECASGDAGIPVYVYRVEKREHLIPLRPREFKALFRNWKRFPTVDMPLRNAVLKLFFQLLDMFKMLSETTRLFPVGLNADDVYVDVTTMNVYFAAPQKLHLMDSKRGYRAHQPCVSDGDCVLTNSQNPFPMYTIPELRHPTCDTSIRMCNGIGSRTLVYALATKNMDRFRFLSLIDLIEFAADLNPLWTTMAVSRPDHRPSLKECLDLMPPVNSTISSQEDEKELSRAAIANVNAWSIAMHARIDKEKPIDNSEVKSDKPVRSIPSSGKTSKVRRSNDMQPPPEDASPEEKRAFECAKEKKDTTLEAKQIHPYLLNCTNINSCLIAEPVENEELGHGWGFQVHLGTLRTECLPIFYTEEQLERIRKGTRNVLSDEGLKVAVKRKPVKKVVKAYRHVEQNLMMELGDHENIPKFFGECDADGFLTLVTEYGGPYPLLEFPVIESILKSASPKASALKLAKQMVELFDYISNDEHRYWATDLFGNQLHYDDDFNLMMVDMDHLMVYQPSCLGYKGGDKCDSNADCSGVGHAMQHLAPEMYGICNTTVHMCQGTDRSTHVYTLAAHQGFRQRWASFATFRPYIPELKPIADKMLTEDKRQRPTFEWVREELNKIHVG